MTSQLNVALICKLRGSLICLAYVFDILSMDVFTIRHRQTSRQVEQEINICTVVSWVRVKTLVRIACRASIFKSNDVRLKRLTNNYRWCTRCELAEEENAKHVIMQCPEY